MLIAVLILSVVVLIEGYIIVEKEGRIIYLRKRLLRQIRMTDSLKAQLNTKKVLVVEKPDYLSAEKTINDFKASPVYQSFLERMSMPIEMTEVK